MSKNLLLVDGYNLVFRSYYAFPTSITSPKGTPVNVIFGFITLLYKTIDLFNPTYLAICWDRKEPTFRHITFPEYKAHRPPPPPDLIEQVDELKNVLSQLNFHQVDKAGFEADDLIGTYSLIAENEGVDTIIYTGDMDCTQLISEHVKIATNKRGSTDMLIMDNEQVLEKYGVTVSQIIDYKALKGDSSDNIPGVKGVGDKTASNLLAEFDSIDGIYANIEHVKSKSVREKLKRDKDMAYLSKKLVTIDRYIPIELSLEDLSLHLDWSVTYDIFKLYQFSRLLTAYKSKFIELSNDNTSELINERITYRSIDSVSDLKQLLPELESGFAIDLETTSLQGVEAQIVGIALSTQEKSGVYVVCNDYLNHQTEEETGQLFSFETNSVSKSAFSLNPFLKLLKPLLENEGIPKYTHNGKYETVVLANYGINLKGIVFDTMLAAFLLYPGEKVGLKSLVSRHLGFEMTNYEDLVGKGNQQIRFDEVAIEQATQYAAADADFTYRLKLFFEDKLKLEQLDCLYYDIELPTQYVLSQMEIAGVNLDMNYLHQLSSIYQKRAEELTSAIYQLAGKEFNINSTKQLAAVLFDDLNLPVIKKTKTGRSTDSSVLEKLKDQHLIAEALLEYRMLEKLLNTYINALPHMVSSKTHKIHTSFNQTVALTGRLSSTQPNLQNIPIRSAEGQAIRRAFVPFDPSDFILSADYSQIELRLIAHLSKDQNMIKAFCDGQDIHASTASIINNIALSEVTKDQRYRAKAVNFGIIYGISAFGLSENLGVSRKEAQEIIDNYFEKFPAIKLFMEDTIQYACEHRLVRTEFGRIRPVPDIDSRLFQRRQFAERVAINTRVQGTAADIIKLAMVNIQKEIELKKLSSQMILQVHDELVFNVPDAEKELLADLVKKEMESVVSYTVPLSVDMSFAKNWAEID